MPGREGAAGAAAGASGPQPEASPPPPSAASRARAFGRIAYPFMSIRSLRPMRRRETSSRASSSRISRRVRKV